MNSKIITRKKFFNKIALVNNLNIDNLIKLSNIYFNLIKKYSQDAYSTDINYPDLSDEERAQLGESKPGSSYSYVKPEDWKEFRSFLVEQSKGSNPLLDSELTAYTPGETVNLLNNPKIVKWMNEVRNFRIPEEYKIIALVPCAKTKPWGATRPKKSDLYNALNKIIDKQRDAQLNPKGKIYFVTISEPLGVVPQDLWDNFPQYDNPGLFRDPVMRSGLFTKDYENTPIKTKHIIPFDETAYEQAIKNLGSTIEQFINNNKLDGRVFVSFVEDQSGRIKTTHSDMLDKANVAEILPPEQRFPKPSGKTSRNKETPIDHYMKYLEKV